MSHLHRVLSSADVASTNKMSIEKLRFTTRRPYSLTIKQTHPLTHAGAPMPFNANPANSLFSVFQKLTIPASASHPFFFLSSWSAVTFPQSSHCRCVLKKPQQLTGEYLLYLLLLRLKQSGKTSGIQHDLRGWSLPEQQYSCVGVNQCYHDRLTGLTWLMWRQTQAWVTGSNLTNSDEVGSFFPSLCDCVEFFCLNDLSPPMKSLQEK